MKAQLVLIVVAVFGGLAGCTTPDRPPDSRAEFKPLLVAEEQPTNVTPLRVTGGGDAVNEELAAIDLSPSPELASAVRRGEAQPAGPITDERYRRWWATADLRIRLEVRLAQHSHLRKLLTMADDSETQFLERFGIGGVGPGESADLQLRMYQAVRERLQKRLVTTDLEITGLREEITRLSGTRDNSTLLGDTTMPEKALAECGFDAAQIAKLDGLGIRTARDFALQFYLPQQHETAAKLLGIDLAEAQRLVRETAKEVSEEELNELVREARRPYEFGVLPPDIDDKEALQ